MVSRIELIRPKSRFTSARAAWADIAKKTGLEPHQVKPAHSAKAWVWLPTKSSGINFKRGTKARSERDRITEKIKKLSKGRTKRNTAFAIATNIVKKRLSNKRKEKRIINIASDVITRKRAQIDRI